MGSDANISNLCRLCSLEVEGGFDIFAESDVKASLVILINKYLPIKVKPDGILPKQICEPCHIGVAATVDLIDRMVQGQQRLRQLCKSFYEKLENKDLSQNEEHGVTKTKYLFSNQDTHFPHTLINLQGSTSDIEMDDLAKGTDVQKVYDLHPMFNIVEGKRKRGRRKHKKELETVEEPKIIENITSTRPTRKKLVPARFKDTITEKEFDTILQGSESNINKVEVDDDFQSFENEDQEGSLLSPYICKKEETHSLEGNTVIVTSNVFDESTMKLPAAVNIELDFENTKTPPHDSNEDNSIMVTDSLLPKASISAISECEISSSLRRKFDKFKKHKLLKYQNQFRGSKKKCMKICDICGAKFVSKLRFISHMEQHKKDNFRCEQCLQEFSGLSEIKKHQQMEDHSGIGIFGKEKSSILFECPSCTNRFFTSFSSFQTHFKRSHNKEKPFACSICNKTFTSKQSRDNHLESHQGKRFSYPCSECDRIFAFSNSLRYHESSCHDTARKFVCSNCGKTFKSRVVLDKHLLSHSEERPYKCSICGFRCKKNVDLQSHMYVHNKRHSFPCLFCGKIFTRRSTLDRHKRTHNEDPSFKCSTCGKTFHQKSNLIEHCRIHSGLKPFKCSVCQKSFTTSSQLSIHKKRNCKEFRCSRCLKVLLGKAALIAHQATHRGSPKPVDASIYQCHLCEREYRDPLTFNKHLAWHGCMTENSGTVEVSSQTHFVNDENEINKPLLDLHSEQSHKGDKASWIVTHPSTIPHTIHSPYPPHPQPSISTAIPTASSFSEESHPESVADSSQDIVYVFPRKDSNTYQFIPFVNETFFETNTESQARDLSSIVHDATSGLTLLPSVTNTGPFAKTMYTSDNNQIEVNETALIDLPLKDADDLNFTLNDTEVL